MLDYGTLRLTATGGGNGDRIAFARAAKRLHLEQRDAAGWLFGRRPRKGLLCGAPPAKVCSSCKIFTPIAAGCCPATLARPSARLAAVSGARRTRGTVIYRPVDVYARW